MEVGHSRQIAADREPVAHLQAMFEEAICLSLRNSEKALCWYPYSYLIGYLLRRVKLLTAAVDHPGETHCPPLYTRHSVLAL